MLSNPTPLYDFIDELQAAGWTQPSIWLQLVVVMACAAAAWLVSRLLRVRLRRDALALRWRFGSEGVARVLLPVLFWLGIEAATPLWGAKHSVTLLKLAASLATALVMVRVAVYILQAVFVQAQWVARYEKFIALSIWLLFALHLSGLLPELADFLDAIEIPIGKQRVSLLMMVNGLFSVALTMLGALWAGRLFEQRLMAVESLDLSLRVVVNKVVRTVLVVLGVLIALPLVGIDLTVLSVMGGAVGVGLGFGLQKVASNYVSGFIILLDGSTRIGDLVSIENRQGTVSKITARYVLLKLLDGSEAVIPNEVLITSTVLNLSHSDRLSYVALPVRISYDANLELARQLLLDALQGEERVLAEPAPSALVKAFADGGIDLDLGFWVADLQNGVGGLRSAIYLKIWQAFTSNGIALANQKRELLLVDERSGLDLAQSSSRR